MKSKYLTDTGKDITDNLDKGKTKMFDSRLKADEFATERKTYVFDIYREKNRRKTWYAYGVPLK